MEMSAFCGQSNPEYEFIFQLHVSRADALLCGPLPPFLPLKKPYCALGGGGINDGHGIEPVYPKTGAGRPPRTGALAFWTHARIGFVAFVYACMRRAQLALLRAANALTGSGPDSGRSCGSCTALAP